MDGHTVTAPDIARADLSLWAHSAGPPPTLPIIEADRQVEILVVGAGYTGLSAAIALLERGAEVAVIDAGMPGAGASGRNGGQVVPAFKRLPKSLIAEFGEEIARNVISMATSSADRVFGLIAHHRIECDAVQRGWIQAACSPSGESILRERSGIWSQWGVPCRPIDATEVASLSGTSGFSAGWMIESAGSVHPQKLVHGLCTAVQRLGGTVFANSPVLSLNSKADRWLLRVGNGHTVTAKQVVLATNGYTTNLWPGLSKSVVPLYSMQIATDPLPSTIGAGILPQGQTMTDDNHLVHYFRRDAQGRFVIGSRGPFSENPDARAVQNLTMRAYQMYPQLDGIKFPFRWAGRVAMTIDSVPHLLKLAPNLTAAIGYNGRGVALATAMGSILAGATLGDTSSALNYPIMPLKTIPFHSMNRLGVQFMVGYYQLADRFRRRI